MELPPTTNRRPQSNHECARKSRSRAYGEGSRNNFRLPLNAAATQPVSGESATDDAGASKEYEERRSNQKPISHSLLRSSGLELGRTP
jgi:hypothetical protein